MKKHALGLLGSVALSLLANQALAVKITSATVETGRVEGQSVAVSAVVDFEDPVTTGPTPINPLIRTIRSVTAAVSVPGVSASPPITTSVTLTRDATGVFQGVLPDLPAGSFNVQFLATRTVYDGTHLPPSTTRTSATLNRTASVGLPAGCFRFQNQSLQGFTAKGFFADDGSTIVVPGSFNPQWSPIGFANANSSDGSFFLNLVGAQPPAQSQVDDFFRLDIVSPDLGSNADWQGIKGLSFRYQATTPAQVQLHAVLRTNTGSGVFTQFNADGTPFTSLALAQSFQTMVEQIALPAGSKVTGVDIRVFGVPGAVLPSLLFDAICPRH